MKHIDKRILVDLPDYALQEIYLNAKETYDRATVRNAAEVNDSRIKKWEAL